MQDHRGEFFWIGERFLRDFLCKENDLKYFESKEEANSHFDYISKYIEMNYDSKVKYV